MSEIDWNAGNQPGPIQVNGQQLTWVECLEHEQARSSQLNAWAGIVHDLDRSPNGRHEGDVESQDPTGVSQGNPFIREGDVFGFDIAGRPYRMPPRAERSKIEAWRVSP